MKNTFTPMGYALHNLVKKAILRDDQIFYHESIDEDGTIRVVGTYFNLPSPQRTGTTYQQNTYASQAAWEFMKNHKI